MAKLKYKDKDGFWQELQVGTNVVANPALTGTEQELTSLQVGNVKYKSGGGKVYAHCLLFTYNEGNESVAFIVYSNSRLEMTNVEPLFRKRICCAYTDPTLGGGAIWVYFEEQLTTGPKMTVKGVIQRNSSTVVIDYNTTNYTMSDTVIEL